MEAIEAIIWLKPINRSGKSVGWRPHLCVTAGHNDRNDQPIYMSVHLSHLGVGETEWLHPAETGRVTFQLMVFDATNEGLVEIYRPLQRGREFEIREGGTTVGTGCVQRRFNDSQ